MPKIMLAEDDQTMITLLETLLGMEGYQVIALAIGDDVLYGDDIQRENTAHFDECKKNDFKTEGCEKYHDRINSEISGIYVDLDK